MQTAAKHTKPTARLPLTALRAFEAAARHLSFKEAALELGVTPASVSNQIRQLEKNWVCQLFVRKTRQVELTLQGHALLGVVAHAFADLQTGVSALGFAGFTPQSMQITLAVGPLFGTRWLAPRLSRWYDRYPQWTLALRQGEPVSPSQPLQTTAAIVWGSGNWPGLQALRLLDCWLTPVASPALLRKCGGLSAIADLSRVAVVHQQDRADWCAWMALSGEPDARFAQETVMADANMATQAAIDGQGVALGVFPLVQADVDAGRLVCPLPTPLHPGAAYYLVTRIADQHRPEVQALRAWMAAESA